jgi:acyl carrier protein
MDRVNNLIGMIFGCDGAALTDNDSPQTIAKWDSVTHIMLLSAIEDEFGVKFTDDQMASIHTIGEIRNAVASQIGA